ncbi:MAG: type I-E CRISPR-associated protein Cas7/Cse4/CasC, partial [Phycisphaerales bacterium]|nr:type I-E CRISPR-associated protein Cas7/Cse4/CasC [Phycisphaerales bacterium]
LWFLPQSAINELGEATKVNGDLGEAFASIIAKYVGENAVHVPDIALCGRMTEFEAKGPFADLKGRFSVEAALSAAHAISTHAVVNEVDYFTAADDIPGSDAGAAHVNEAVFNSACFYKHFSIDWEQLLKNLGGDANLATLTVRCFLEAAAKANPSGKQHAYAAFNPPDGILVEVKTQRATPVSYANAFVDPVPEKSQQGLIGESVARLGQYVHEIANGYGIEAERFWFSPSLRYQLTHRDGKRESPAIPEGGNIGDFGKFIESVMAAVRQGQGAGAVS